MKNWNETWCYWDKYISKSDHVYNIRILKVGWSFMDSSYILHSPAASYVLAANGDEAVLNKRLYTVCMDTFSLRKSVHSEAMACLLFSCFFFFWQWHLKTIQAHSNIWPNLSYEEPYLLLIFVVVWCMMHSIYNNLWIFYYWLGARSPKMKYYLKIYWFGFSKSSIYYKTS